MLVAWWFAWGCAPAGPPEGALVAPPTERPVRLVETAAGPVLEVASDRYHHPDGGELLLQGAVHVATLRSTA